MPTRRSRFVSSWTEFSRCSIFFVRLCRLSKTLVPEHRNFMASCTCRRAPARGSFCQPPTGVEILALLPGAMAVVHEVVGCLGAQGKGEGEQKEEGRHLRRRLLRASPRRTLLLHQCVTESGRLRTEVLRPCLVLILWVCRAQRQERQEQCR